jgi:hypothetical protein
LKVSLDRLGDCIARDVRLDHHPSPIFVRGVAGVRGRRRVDRDGVHVTLLEDGEDLGEDSGAVMPNGGADQGRSVL